MIFNDWAHRRLAAQLHPWLRDEPHLEVKLGLFRSNGTITNITFDTSKLNELLDDPSVYCFKEVTVEHLSLKFSPFSSTAFTLVIRGIRVVVSLGEENDEGGVKWRPKCRDTTVEDRNKVLQDIDPEGCALHGSIKKISEMTTTTWGKSILNTILRHCRLQLLDIHVRLQTSRSHDPLSCSLYMKKFEIGSHIMGQRCFTRGFMSSFFGPSEETSFDVDVGSFEIRLNSDKISSCIFPATNMFVLVSMNHLHFTRFCFRIPTLKFLLSTADVSVLLLLYGLLSKGSKCTRTGRQLWNIVASRSKSLLTAPKMTLIKVVRILCLSLQYIKTYRSMLLLVGYPTDKTMRRSTTLMLWDARYSSSVKSQWEKINQIETDLPLESIILARRIIRSTMASTGTGENKGPDKLVAYDGLFSKLHQLIALILSTVINFLYSVMRILSLHKAVGWSSGKVQDIFLLQQSISLNVQEISLSVSPDVEVRSSVRKKGGSNSAVSHHNFLSFHLSIDGFFLQYTENMSEKRLTSASGRLKILSSIVKGGGISYVKENQDKELNGRCVMIWSDPAQVDYFPEDTQNETCSVPHLASHLKKLWLHWKDSCLKSAGECTPSVQSPWILCDIRSFLTDHGLNSRFLDCSLVVGKLNCNLDYSAVPPITVLLRQIQYAIWCTQKKMKGIPPRTPQITVQDVVGDWHSTFKSFSSKIEMDIIRMFPEKHIQMGVLVEGPHIRVSLLNDDFGTELTGDQLISQVALKICNIELWVSPNLDDNHALEPKSGSEYLGIEEPLESNILKSDSVDYSCQGEISLDAYLRLNGLEVYLGRSTENQKYQIVVLSPMTAQLKYLRKDYHSFGSSVVAFSAVCHCVATGFSSLVYLDELYIFTKIIHLAFYESIVPDYDGSNGGLDHEELNRNAVNLESESGEMFFNDSSPESRETRFIFSTTCEIKSFDVVLHNSRKIVDLEEHIKSISIQEETGGKLAMPDSCGNGIYLSVQPLNAEFVSKGGIIDVVIDAAGVQLFIFECLTGSEGSSDKSELRNLLSSLNFVTEASVSHTKLCLHLSTIVSTSTLPSACLHNAADNASSIYGEQILGESSSVVSAEKLENQCLFMSLELSGIYMAGCKFKDVLVNESNFEKLSLSFSAGADFRSLSCNSKGGSVLLEASAAVIFAKCFLSYYIWIVGLWPAGQSSSKVEVAESNREMAGLISQHRVNSQEAQIQEFLWDHTEIVSMRLSSLSLVLVATDESGRIQQLLVEADFHLNFKLLDAMREFSASSNLSLLSRFLYGAMEHRSMVVKNPLHTISSRVSPNVSQVDSSSRTQVQKNLHRSPLNYILRDMKCSLSVEGPVKSEQTTPVLSDSRWVGNGSMSGLELTISLSEIKMILSSVEAVSELSIRDGIPKPQSKNWSFNEEPEEITEGMVTDGMVVAIQDTDQHMYIAVGGAETRYDIAGTLHYSLVGERSLFRVKFHNSRWRSKVQYFSLISLHARDVSGEPLQLSGSPQSRYVDISCPNDGASALWRIFPYKTDPYEDVAELESFHSLTKRGFHLVNKKNDCAMAFIDGVLEFVSQPGNLFKWKVFSDPGPSGNSVLPTTHSEGRTSIPSNRSRERLPSPGTTGTNQPSDPNVTNLGELRTNADLPGITITVQKVILTVVHELSDTEEKFPLLQGSLISNQVIMQICDSKVRLMDTFEVAMNYFDAHRNSWTDFMQPVEICTFFCFKFLNQHPEKALGGAPSSFYAKLKEVNILVSELALDILLFVIGEIDLAGPYAVKSSAVLANCCKVENQSGLSLLCQFYDNQDASVSPRQSTTIYLRHLALANRPPEASRFSVQLFQQGNISTSPIHLSLLDAQQFAWRTRIISHDSKSFPGPLIAIEISRTIEDGLSIVISPLLRIHNETDFALDLRFQRLNLKDKEYAPLVLKAGSVMDDTVAAFSAIDLSGGLRKVLTSLSLGNYVFSFRPTIPDGLKNLKISTVEWSDDLKGKKPVRLSGLFDKLSYQVRKALSVDPVKASLSSANCTLISEDGLVTNIHFLIQTTGKGIPVINPDNFGYAPGNRKSPVAMQEQKEVFFLPTVQVSNFLHTEVHVNLTDSDPRNTMDHSNPWGNATIPYGSAVNFYVNPEFIYFVVTLTLFGSSCKPVNSSDWVRKLQKKTNDIRHLDIELEFGGGKYFAMLRLSRGNRGTLKAVIFTSYALQNNTTISLLCFAANKKPSPRSNTERPSSDISPDVGLCLPPNSTRSWFLKCHKLNFTLMEEKAFETELDLDALSGFTEIDLRAEGTFGSKDITRLGVSSRPWMLNEVSSQIVALSSRYVMSNESEGTILVRQCYIEDTEEMIALNSKQRISLKLKTITTNKKETNFVDRLLRKHTKSEEDLSLCVQFRPNEAGFGWSGPVCVASLGRFFLKFRKSSEFPERQSHQVPDQDKTYKFAAVHVVEEGSIIVLHFFSPPPHVNLPYRIENLLRDGPITYYQKGSAEPETLGAGNSINYVWDDLTLPHKLVVQLDDVHLLREINLDKVRSWKPFYRNKQTRNLGLHLPLAKGPEDQKRNTYSRFADLETVKVGYEIYAEGVTRVLRICAFSDRRKVTLVTGSSRKMRLRISYFAVHLLEYANQDLDLHDTSSYAPIIITRLERLNWDCLFTDEHKYNQIRVQSLSVDEKWEGAPFAAVLRRHQTEKSEANDYTLHVALVLLPTSSGVKPVKYLSFVLQPLDLNLDEETLMKIVPFWRKSLSQSSSRQQYYFDHFEIHPIKIVASFLPGDSLYSYSSTQETLRSLLHSVIKIPTIKNKTVELNGVLVTHALITLRELTLKCAQHYSWYAMRAIYIAKGSPLLPPAFASVFDDLASSSLDVFFDPSSGLVNVPGVTLGTLKLISKFIDNKGFSGTKRYFGDLGKTLKTAGSNVLFAAITEVSDAVLKGAETTGVNGMVNGFHQGILKLAMEPSVLSSAFMEGGPDRKIKLDRSPGVDELYIEGYLQAMLDTMYKQEYLKVRVVENQVILKNLPPSSSLIDEIMERVKDFLASKALLKGRSSMAHSLRHIRGEREWRIGPTLLTLCEHLFVSFTIQALRKQAGKALVGIKWKGERKADEETAIVPTSGGDRQKMKFIWKWGIGKFLFSGLVAYVDGRLCRNIPHPLARRIVSGFLLSFLDKSDDDKQ